MIAFLITGKEEQKRRKEKKRDYRIVVLTSYGAMTSILDFFSQLE